ncbi:hypothetical protein AALO_G00308470 [Alosa alosa]|uniref:Uncharacterized protein n=1 Tax=Alosa alosa TaxID=278164 RepID=A0AAV6FHF6_9TELE|nr:hypothetical protein AALO_G00308470 [Alosa alosa]
MSEMSAARISRSIGIVKELMDKTDTELELTRPAGIHHVAREQEDVLTRFQGDTTFPTKITQAGRIMQSRISRETYWQS